MKEIVTTMTQRGQVTVPAEVRRILGLKPRDKVAFRIEEGQVRVTRTEFTLEAAYGSVTPRQRPEDFEAMIDGAMEEHSAQIVRDMGRG